MVKTPSQSFPKFSFPLSNYWGLYTIPNYWVIASGTPSAPPFTSFVFGKTFFVFGNTFFVFGNTFCVCEYFFQIIRYFHTQSITRWHFHSRKVDRFHAKLISHRKKQVSKKNSAGSPKRDWMNIACVSITNIRYVSVTEQKNVNVYFRGAAR